MDNMNKTQQNDRNKIRISENYGTSSAGGVSMEGSKLKMNSMKKKYERGWKN